MWSCSPQLVDDCAEGGMFSAPTSHRGRDACRECVDAIGPAAGPGYDDFQATTSYKITD